MKIHLLVFAAALPAFTNANPVIQVPSDLIRNSSIGDNLSTLLPIAKDAPAGRSRALQRRWNPEYDVRPASDSVWNRYVDKGRILMAQMSSSDFDAAQMFPEPKDTAQSPYSFKSLKKWGYTIYDTVDSEYRDFEHWGIAPVLELQGVSYSCTEEGGTWKAGLIQHGDPEDRIPITRQRYRSPDGKIKKMTGAIFHMAVTPEGGIMTQVRESPWESLKSLHPNAKVSDLPRMQRSSDMMWAMWEHFIPSKFDDQIKFFITLSIENLTTLSLIRRALRQMDDDLTTEGSRIYMDTDEALALLASPNGAGFAHFLVERKAQIGLKTMDFVWVMQCEDSEESACMIFVTKDLRRPRRSGYRPLWNDDI